MTFTPNSTGAPLINADRWTPTRARELLDDIWGCGPAAAVDLPAAA